MVCLVCHLMCLSTKTTENSISLLRLRGEFQFCTSFLPVQQEDDMTENGRGEQNKKM